MLCAGLRAQVSRMSPGHFLRHGEPFLSGTAAALYLGDDRLFCFLLVLQSPTCGDSALNEHADWTSVLGHPT